MIAQPQPSPDLLRKVSANEAMIEQIDRKVAALGIARKLRVAALLKIRSELARAGQAGPSRDENQ